MLDHTRTLRILVVEDEILTVLALESRLEELSCAIVGVASTEESALELAAATRPDLALVDVRLREGSGIDAARRMQEEFGIPTIFTTGSTDPVTLDRIEAIKPAAVLRKPFMDDQLVTVLSSWARQQA